MHTRCKMEERKVLSAVSESYSFLKKVSSRETSPSACFDTAVCSTHIWLKCFFVIS